MTRTRETVFIIAFTFAAFVLGTTEYVIVGLLKDISVSLSISLAAPGVLVSSFAIAYALGTPFAVTFARTHTAACYHSDCVYCSVSV